MVLSPVELRDSQTLKTYLNCFSAGCSTDTVAAFLSNTALCLFSNSLNTLQISHYPLYCGFHAEFSILESLFLHCWRTFSNQGNPCLYLYSLMHFMRALNTFKPMLQDSNVAYYSWEQWEHWVINLSGWVGGKAGRGGEGDKLCHQILYPLPGQKRWYGPPRFCGH